MTHNGGWLVANVVTASFAIQSSCFPWCKAWICCPMVISGKSGFSSSSFLSSSLSPLCVRGERAGRWAVGAPIRRRILSATNPRSRIFGGQSEATDFRRTFGGHEPGDFRWSIRGQGFSAAHPRPKIFGGGWMVRARRIAIGAQYIFPWFGSARSNGLAQSNFGGISDITTKCLYPILSGFCPPHFGTPPWLIWLQGKELE